jgi:hypothetical protein
MVATPLIQDALRIRVDSNGLENARRPWKVGSNRPRLSVFMLVETSYAANGRKSSVAYDHLSLRRTLKVGFGLPCLNHACDATSLIMNDMFGGK